MRDVLSIFLRSKISYNDNKPSCNSDKPQTNKPPCNSDKPQGEAAYITIEMEVSNQSTNIS